MGGGGPPASYVAAGVLIIGKHSKNWDGEAMNFSPKGIIARQVSKILITVCRLEI